MSERHYFNIDDPYDVLENASFIAMLSDYTFSDADKKELQAYNYIRLNASEKILQAFATRSTLVRNLQRKYKEHREQEAYRIQESQRKQEARQRRKEWVAKHRKHLIVTAIVTLVLLLGVGGAVVAKAYNDNYNDYINDYLHTQAQNNKLRFKVSIKTTRTEYNHLGTNISIEHTINRQLIKNGDTIPQADSFTFKTVITERDGIDDVGYKSSSVDLPTYVERDFKRTITQNITVREEGGTKYPNASAKYEVTVTFTPYIDKDDINFWDVVFYK